MRFLHRFAPLSLCCVLLLGMLGTAHGEETPVYYSDPYPMEELYFGRDATYDEFLEETQRWTNLYPNGDEEEAPLSFLIQWNQAEWDAGVSGEEDTFTVSGVYEPEREEWADETLAQWEAGSIAVDSEAPPTATVHRQPTDLVVIYTDAAREIQTRTIYPSTPFEEAAANILTDYTNLPQKEEPNSPFLPGYMGFDIVWDKEQYEEKLAYCIAEGETSFELTGRYALADSTYEGIATVEGAPKEIVAIKQPPDLDAPDVYIYDWGDTPSANVYLVPDAAFSSLTLPQQETLTLQGQEVLYGYDMEFGIAWAEAEYEDGMATGQDFTLYGAYVPLPEWPVEAKQWWEEGRIRVAEDTARPELKVYLLHDGLSFTVEMQDRSDYLTPVFSFPWPNGAELVTISISFDKNTWYTAEVPWDEAWEYELAGNWDDFYDAEENLVSISPEDPRPFYAKLTVVGSAFAGETKVMIVSPGENGEWEMTEDPGGDHGGGGQGEHDRPGKDEPDDSDDPPPVPDPKPTPTPTPTPSPEPTPSPSPEPTPTPSPEPVPTPDPDLVPPASDPQEELAVAAITPVQAEPVPSTDGGKTAHGSDAAQASQAPKPSQEPAPSPSEAVPEEESPETVPESRTPPESEPTTAPPASPMPTDSPQAPASHIPGFVWASAATAAMVLGGAVWLHWRGKRK